MLLNHFSQLKTAKQDHAYGFDMNELHLKLEDFFARSFSKLNYVSEIDQFKLSDRISEIAFNCSVKQFIIFSKKYAQVIAETEENNSYLQSKLDKKSEELRQVQLELEKALESLSKANGVIEQLTRASAAYSSMQRHESVLVEERYKQEYSNRQDFKEIRMQLQELESSLEKEKRNRDRNEEEKSRLLQENQKLGEKITFLTEKVNSLQDEVISTRNRLKNSIDALKAPHSEARIIANEFKSAHRPGGSRRSSNSRGREDYQVLEGKSRIGVNDSMRLPKKILIEFEPTAESRQHSRKATAREAEGDPDLNLSYSPQFRTYNHPANYPDPTDLKPSLPTIPTPSKKASTAATSKATYAHPRLPHTNHSTTREQTDDSLDKTKFLDDFLDEHPSGKQRHKISYNKK